MDDDRKPFLCYLVVPVTTMAVSQNDAAIIAEQTVANALAAARNHGVAADALSLPHPHLPGGVVHSLVGPPIELNAFLASPDRPRIVARPRTVAAVGKRVSMLNSDQGRSLGGKS